MKNWENTNSHIMINMKKIGLTNTILLKTSDLFGTMHFKKLLAAKLQEA